MFKKFLLVFVVAISALLLVACGERTYAADGVYTAFRWELHSNNGPQVSSVSVTIEKDKVTGYYIDVIQNTKTVTPATDTTPEKVAYAFNAKTKKELKYEYRMHGQRDKNEADYKAWLAAEGKKEWFEQAELIEKFFLENGPEALTVDATSKAINNVGAGVTIKDGGYSELAKQALQLAKEGKAQAWVPSGNSVVFATAKVDKKGKFTELTLDTIQGSVKDGKYVWNAKTKLQLGDDYNMEGVGAKYALEGGEWKDTGAKSENEWFKQSKMITDFVLENGIENVKSIKDRGISTDGSKLAVTGVTVKTNDYIKVLNNLYNNFK